MRKKVSRGIQRQRERRRAKRLVADENDKILRALALMRDEHCVVCGGTDHLQVSHIWCKQKYPHMRWLLENVEIRCAGDHFYKKGSPHGDPAGFARWLEEHLPEKRKKLLYRESQNVVEVTTEYAEEVNAKLKKKYLQQAGAEWGT